MKTRMKRIISLLCAVTVFASTVLSTDFLSAKVEASSGQEKESLPTDMTEISFRDFGIADIENHQGWAGKEYTGETLDNTLFSGTVIFPKVAGAYITYAGDAVQTGLGLFVAQDETTQEWYLRLYHSNTSLLGTLQNEKIYAKTAGVEQLVGAPLELHISMEYVDNDGKGAENDLKLGIWFGDTLYKDEYIYINDYVDANKTGTYLTYNSKKADGGAITLKSANIKLPKGMTEITLEDFNIADDEYSTSFSSNYAGETMDNTLFSVKIKYPEPGVSHFIFGGSKAYGGFALQNAVDQDEKSYLRMWDTDRANMKFQDKKFYADKAGVETFINKEFTLNYTMEYVNNDDGTTKNDLKLGVWFNGILYENKYIYINNYVDNGHSVGGYITVWPQNGATIGLKSCNYQLPDNMTDISFRDYDFADIENYQGWAGKEYTGETLDNTLFSGTVIFPKVAGAYITYAGEGPQAGLGFTVAQNEHTQEWYLKLSHSNNTLLGVLQNEKIYAKTAGVEQLVGVPLELHISMEYVNLDDQGGENDLKLGVWFGDTLYKDEYIYIKDYVGASKTGTYLTYNSKKADGGAITLKSADIKLPTDMKAISFHDFEFIKDGEYTGTHYGQYEGETLDNTLFSGKITFPKNTGAQLEYGGKILGGGLELVVREKDGEYYLGLRNPKGSQSIATFNEKSFKSDVADVTLVGEELELNISVEYINRDGGTTENDLKLGMWFGKKLYENKYIYIDNYVDNEHSMGTGLTFQIDPTTNINIKSVGEIDWKPIPTGMTELTFHDFEFIKDGGYTGSHSGQYEGETLDNTLFSGKITFPKNTGAQIEYGGKVAGGGLELVVREKDGKYHLGLRDPMSSQSTGTFKEIPFNSDEAGVTLVGEELELNISMEYVNHDGGTTENDLKLGMWFGGKLYKNRYIYIDNYVDNTHSIGTWFKFTIAETTSINIKSVGEINWKPFPERLTEITFRDFGLTDGDYTQYPDGQYEGETLNNTLFRGKITFPENDNVHMIYGGKVSGGGIGIAVRQDEKSGEYYLVLRNPKADESVASFKDIKFYSDVANVQLVGKELDLGISLEYINHDGGTTENDVKLGMWFGGKLYKNKYIYLDNYVDNSHSMGTWMYFSIAKTTSVNIKSLGEIKWKPMPTNLTEITFRDFGFTDGEYTKYPDGQYEGETLNNTLFRGKITFPENANVHMIYGGKIPGGGIGMAVRQDEKSGEYYLELRNPKAEESVAPFSGKKLYSNVAGVQLVGKELDVAISLEYINHDGGKTNNDVKLGVWFEGKLYNNNYIYIDNYVDNSHSMGTWLYFSINKTTQINIKSVGAINWKPLPTGLTEIGFSDFGITSGVYEAGSKVGEYTGENLRNTLFSGIVKWHPEVGETHFIYGGTTSGGGFDLVNVTDEKTGEHYLRLFYTTPTKDGKKTYTNYYFHSDVAGVTLVGEELELKISIEYVDNDGGKKDNDVRLGIWFGGKLYNNRYIYINNFGATGHILKNNIQIWNRNGASFSVGRISDWLDWSAFGLNANWKKTLLDTDFNLEYTLAGGNPYTGDNTTFPCLTVAVCLLAVALCGYQIIRKGRREDGQC